MPFSIGKLHTFDCVEVVAVFLYTKGDMLHVSVLSDVHVQCIRCMAIPS